MQLQVSNTIKRGKLIVSVQKVGSVLITSRCRILRVIHLPHPVGVSYNSTGSTPSSTSLGKILCNPPMRIGTVKVACPCDSGQLVLRHLHLLYTARYSQHPEDLPTTSINCSALCCDRCMILFKISPVSGSSSGRKSYACVHNIGHSQKDILLWMGIQTRE